MRAAAPAPMNKKATVTMMNRFFTGIRDNDVLHVMMLIRLTYHMSLPQAMERSCWVFNVDIYGLLFILL